MKLTERLAQIKEDNEFDRYEPSVNAMNVLMLLEMVYLLLNETKQPEHWRLKNPIELLEKIMEKYK